MRNQQEYEEAVARAQRLDKVTACTVLSTFNKLSITTEHGMKTMQAMYVPIVKARLKAWDRVRELVNESIRNG